MESIRIKKNEQQTYTSTVSMIHKFVKTIPDKLEDDVLYVSIEHLAVAHKCCCGCGKKVNTPLSPTGWELKFNGETISINPSIDNSELDCRSHYRITNNKVKQTRKWSEEEIELRRVRDRINKKSNAPYSTS